ncbi:MULTISPECIES: cyclic peptide export ABC transporter [Ralstonia solanacearum species complex]|uniref:Cyclic peptide transporter protein n=1 Tax=Ralstonia solanacearum IPO1609 TaxID=564066 RepID=A0A7U7JDV3_RALSL|nr:cyclic peptide export ABC transporter [Ralstonia solanacearum]ALF90157.1 ABC transporter ATP-binding protein YojI [Ralstonia solanacearum]ATI29641.1 ABC transporter ATP-binding protein [Ralstonia solanacearum]ATJ88392.1 ABC transporter ATP-binding protein [Ralstonia solanacearum]KEI30715.1 ABC transporter ATP-binding protein [Ralstonia solanacearum]KFX78626.1 ABC transporter ATP-binding protein [Ralstonia solanacearum]
MRITKLLLGRSGWPTMLMVVASQAAAGLGGAGLLAVLTHAAGEAGRTSTWRYLLWAVAALTLFVLAQGIAARLTTACVEDTIHATRMRIMDKLASATLQTFERIGESHLLTRLEKDLKVVSATSVAMLSASQAGMLFCCSIVYLAYLSPMAFGICAIVVVLSLLLHAVRMRVIHARMEAATRAETGLLSLIGHMVGGFKELKLHARRQHELSAELAAASEHGAGLNRAAYVTVSDHLILIQIILYGLIGSVVFILPLLDMTQPLLLVQIVAVILFLAGALNHFAGILPMYTQADAAARHLETLEHELTDEPAAGGLAQSLPAPVMSVIELEAVHYAYTPVNGQGFKVGPVNLSIRPGEIVFITGSNGSGKSTFLKLLTGLQAPDAGLIRWNGDPVDPGSLARYRGLFSAIFSDYHLFPTLWGLDAPDPGTIEAHLRCLALQALTSLDGRSFSPLKLSTGQRKRLAHLVALLEDRPIYVFDEWAADQDPSFRRWFYHTELPRLKALGKTVVAVTHDEPYFDCADRWVHFEEGRCVERALASARPTASTPVKAAAT